MDPKELCRCGHEREWHDACSKCFCPFFLTADAPPEIVRAWKRAGTRRKRKEAGK